ncbi:MAG: hypothetical protein ACPG6L_02975 [Nereida ignava]
MTMSLKAWLLGCILRLCYRPEEAFMNTNSGSTARRFMAAAGIKTGWT